jgi:hypothetical protein
MPAAVPDSTVLGNVAAFRRYMDDLRSTPAGSRVRDSILRARPGLMDSINAIESLYKN